MILAGDIGGTKTVLATCELGPPSALPRARSIAIVREEVYPCADYPSLEAILDEFLPPGAPHDVAAACFGVAGPVVAGTAKITNLPWTIDAAVVAARLRVPVALLNDLQATALGALVLPPSAFAAPSINPSKIVSRSRSRRGQPFVFASSVCRPATLMHASSSLQTPS